MWSIRVEHEFYNCSTNRKISQSRTHLVSFPGSLTTIQIISQCFSQKFILYVQNFCSSTVNICIFGQAVTVSQCLCIESMCTDALSLHPRARSHAGHTTTGNYCAVVKHHYSLVCLLAPSVLLGATLHTISTAPRTTPPT